MVAVSERSIALAYLLEIKRLLVELSHRVGIPRSDGDVTKLGHLGSFCWCRFSCIGSPPRKQRENRRNCRDELRTAHPVIRAQAGMTGFQSVALAPAFAGATIWWA